MFGFDFLTPQLVTSCLLIVVVLHMMMGAAAYLVLLERRVCAWVQDRCGPNRVGPLGLLQPIADSLKLFLKEDFIPRGADRALFIMAPGLTVFPALIGFAVIPWAGTLDLTTLPFGLASTLGVAGEHVRLIGADVNIGLIYLVAVGSLGVYGVAIGGWASNNKYSFLGGLRATAQMISYEIPLGLSILAIILMAGSVRPYEIVHQQLGDAGPWFLLQQPIVAVLFFTCMLAEANRSPFDLAEAESELVGGWHTEYSSMKWALFFMGEYAHIVVGSAFFTMLFLGGWSVNPLWFGPDLPAAGGVGLIMLQFAVVGGKVFGLVFLIMMIRWTIPRFRFDQLMRLAWEGMIPTSLLLLMITSVFVYLGRLDQMWVGSLIAMVIILLVQPLLPDHRRINRRVQLIGSRFSPVSDEQVRTAPTDPLALSDDAIQH